MMLRSPFRCLFLYLSGPAKANGAELPPTPTAAAPTPARFSSSRREKAVAIPAPPFLGLPARPPRGACGAHGREHALSITASSFGGVPGGPPPVRPAMSG